MKTLLSPKVFSSSTFFLAIGGIVVATAACSAASSEPATGGGNPAGNSSNADGTGDGTQTGAETTPTGNDAGTAPKKDAGSGGGGTDSGSSTSCTQSTFYADADGDGYGDVMTTTSACSAPSGFVADKTDCNDKDPNVHPKATELCNDIDDDCDGTVDAPACSALVGTYKGAYMMHTDEALGGSVINDMKCSGTDSITIDPSAKTVVSGTVTCTYSGGLTAFSKTQNGTIAASVQPDGTVKGSVTHQFDDTDSSTSRTFTFTGSLKNHQLAIGRTGASWLPNPMSAQPWDVDFTVAGQ
jgi:hypothetical protein